LASARTPRAGQPHTLLGLSHVQKAPNWSFGSKPPPDADKDVPGPGTYVVAGGESTSRYAKSSHFSFGSSAREVLTKQKIPGPGTYSPPSDFGKHGKGGFTMPERKMPRATGNRDYPAPGKYEIQSRVGEGPKFSASSKQKEKTVLAQPGPGDYDDVKSEATGDRQPRCCFGTAGSAATASVSNATPGPGTYTPGLYAETPRFTMKAKPKQSKIEESPGPGSHGGHYSTLGDYKPSAARVGGPSPRGASTGVGRKPTMTPP